RAAVARPRPATEGWARQGIPVAADLLDGRVLVGRRRLQLANQHGCPSAPGRQGSRLSGMAGSRPLPIVVTDLFARDRLTARSEGTFHGCGRFDADRRATLGLAADSQKGEHSDAARRW